MKFAHGKSSYYEKLMQTIPGFERTKSDTQFKYKYADIYCSSCIEYVICKHDLCPYIMENGEIDVYKESKKLNGTCRDDIDNAIRNCIVPDARGYRLTDESVKQVIEKHGSERVAVILANTVMSSEWDGRFSPDTKKWAKNIELPHESSLKYCECESHKAVLDGYIRLARKEFEHKPSVIESLRSTESSLTNSEIKKDMKKSKELEM